MLTPEVIEVPFLSFPSPCKRPWGEGEERNVGTSITSFSPGLKARVIEKISPSNRLAHRIFGLPRSLSANGRCQAKGWKVILFLFNNGSGLWPKPKTTGNWAKPSHYKFFVTFGSWSPAVLCRASATNLLSTAIRRRKEEWLQRREG